MGRVYFCDSGTQAQSLRIAGSTRRCLRPLGEKDHPTAGLIGGRDTAKAAPMQTAASVRPSKHRHRGWLNTPEPDQQGTRE
jgi:hypothetical protein